MRSIEDVGSDLLHFHAGIQYVGIFKNDSTNICKYFKSREGELEAKYEDLAESGEKLLSNQGSKSLLSDGSPRLLCVIFTMDRITKSELKMLHRISRLEKSATTYHNVYLILFLKIVDLSSIAEQFFDQKMI